MSLLLLQISELLGQVAIRFCSAKKKSINVGPSGHFCNIWNQPGHGLVLICSSTPFRPLKRNSSLSVTLCSHLRAPNMSV